MEPVIVFDDSSKKKILHSLGLSKGKGGQIIDKKGRVLTDQDFEPVKENEFGGILKGSKITIKKDSRELVKYFVNKK